MYADYIRAHGGCQSSQSVRSFAERAVKGGILFQKMMDMQLPKSEPI